MALLKSLRLVKAGRAGTVLPTNIREVDSSRWLLYCEDIKDKELYCVIGESMSPEGIHTDNILVATKIEENANVAEELKYGSFIILQIPDKTSETCGLKMRKYLMTIDITRPVDELWKELQKKDVFSCGDAAKDLFKEKYNKAKRDENIPNDDQKDVLLSITYTAEHGREYSFHSRKRLCAKVDFYIDNNNEKKNI